MKKIIQQILLLLAVIVMAGACKKSFLDISPTGNSTTLESQYYKTAAQIFTGVVAVYDPLGSETGSSYSAKEGLLDAASDDCSAGGAAPGPDQVNWTAWDKFTVNINQGPQGDLWGRNYTGIYRANLILSKMTATISDLDDGTKARYIAEVKFLRAYYYFDLVRLFKNVPLIIDAIPASDIYTIKQAKPEDVYAQIEKDLTDAIGESNLPSTVPISEGGRITKGAAKALLGKVYLYEQKWPDAAAQFADVNGTPLGTNAYGYHLLPNFSDIFLTNNKFNAESIFEIVHTNQAQQDWGAWGAFEGNVWVQMIGPRNYGGPIYAPGWGFCPLTQSLVDAMKNDPRYPYTCANLDSIASANGISYEHEADHTGWFIEKFMPKLGDKTTLGGTTELNYSKDYIEIRVADTYLMEAEALVQGSGDAARAQSLLDAVRARVGLASIPATLDNIYQERRLELATEGHRFFDLVRTGKAASVLNGFVAGKNELLPIPISELNGTALVQNPNY